MYFVKPNSSRYANSEKYIVCKNFRLNDSENLVKKLYNIFKNIEEEKNFERILNIDIPYLYSCRVEEFNAIYGQQQIESISATLNLIDNNKYERLESFKKTNIQKCISWCQRYKLPFNKVITSNNIFLTKGSKEY